MRFIGGKTLWRTRCRLVRSLRSSSFCVPLPQIINVSLAVSLVSVITKERCYRIFHFMGQISAPFDCLNRR